MEYLRDIGGFFSKTFGNGAGGANFGNIAKAGELGLTGAGLFGNLSAEAQKEKIFKELNSPSYLSGAATKLAGNLNPALVQAVNNQVGGTLAEQGLSQSPGIVASTTAGALAPYVEQNYNTALESILRSLGGAAGATPNPTNLAPLLALLTKNNNGGQLPSNFITSQDSNPTAFLTPGEMDSSGIGGPSDTSWFGGQ